MILKEPLIGKHVSLRSAAIDDAEFILDLRLDPERNQFINATPQSVDSQRNWIADQLIRSGDYYFILENRSGENVGTGGIYNIIDGKFNCGRWIIKKHTSPAIAIESIVLSYHFAFNQLQLEVAEFEVRKDNVKVVNFHLSYGAVKKSETDIDVFFEFPKNNFHEMLQKFRNFHTLNY
ncbi:GNAT family N-acetyltransferase [Pedobacter sp. Leaf250]|uniref:GNAT family N-acetyltransferase n=1 Tax=Pedobacter sp. Leaf250 TaxID=2876559 RepID=UPI001E33259F|nr:GNAT family N-acetyltransferase [Pedobacter sp. Leaf250]